MTAGVSLPIWRHVTMLGDLVVLAPCVIVTVVWLAAKVETRTLAWKWLLLQVLVVCAVSSSKLLYMAWGVGIRPLDFIGVSGHSALAAAIWPSLFSLLAMPNRPNIRALAFVLGLVLAFLIAMSRLELHVHSVAEVASGLLLGGCVAISFLRHAGPAWHSPGRVYWCVILIVIMIPFFCEGRFPSERVLRFAAQHLGVDGAVYVRRDLHALPK